MNIEYLYSIIDLYLKKEKENKKTNLSIQKKDDIVEFNFNMNSSLDEKTTCKLSIDDVNIELWKILNIYKQNIMIIDEKYDDKDNYHYEVLLQNGRCLSFDGFNLLEINRIRNILYNIPVDSDQISLKDLDVERKMEYKPSLMLQQAGFIVNSSVFLTVLYITDAFIIALWIFKVLSK